MRIRHYTPADLDALRRLHAAQGFGYPFPDLDSPLFITKLVLEEDSVAQTSVCGSPENSPSRGCVQRAQAECTPTENHLDERPNEREARGGEEISREVAARNSPSGTQPLCEPSAETAQHSSGDSPRILMAVLLRLTAEAYLLHDAAAGTPRERWQNLLALHEAARRDAAARGLDDVQAFLPPSVARAFGRRLSRLGWRHDPWPCFSRLTGV